MVISTRKLKINEHLLTTKLYIPPTRSEVVPRLRLIEKINQGLHRKLTLISAPAGFGKTTLVTEWLETLQLASPADEIENRIAWLSLDERDNDYVRFLTYIIAALNHDEEPEPNLGEKALDLLKSPQSPPPDVTLTSLINDIANITYRMILILDDYHLVENQSIHDATAFLLDNLPSQLRLVIATREDPPLPLPRLRTRNQLTELRAADLRFSSTEAAVFLNQVMGLTLSAGEITALEERTEGWIAGLQLAALSMQGRDDLHNFVEAFTGSHHFVLDYLGDEVLEQQPDDVHRFLLQTSILDRLNGDLCNAVTGQEDGRGMLEDLQRGNLFVIPLDDQRQWYRYHHLFADVLSDHLLEKQPAQVVGLHLRASEWYERHDLPAQAIRHALAAADTSRAADLAELAWPDWSSSYQSIQWLSWVKDLPDDLVRSRPVLCVCCAWAFLNAGQLESAETRLLDAERWLELEQGQGDKPDKSEARMVVVDQEQYRSLPITLATARAYHAQATGNMSGTVKYTQRVLDLLPEGEHPDRATAAALQGLAYWAEGDLESAHQTLSNALAGMKPMDVIIGTFVLADIKNTLGHLQEAMSTCEHALQLAAKHGEPMPLGTEDVHSAIGELHLERGDLDEAARHLAAGKKLGDRVELPDWEYRWCIARARLQASLGNFDQALDLLDQAARVYIRTPLPDIRPIAALNTRVRLEQGRMDESLGWVHERSLSPDDELSYMQEFEHITLARVLINLHKSDHLDGTLRDAMNLLERLLAAAQEGRRTRSMIEILVLQAIAYETKGDIPQALVPLERALSLAEPEGYVQIFVDEDQSMARILYEALSNGIAPDFVRKLQAVDSTPAKKQPALAHTRESEPQYIEPLSKREIEVLELIAQGLTNQEIAARLYLSLHTVKVHARNIYGKLGVKNRTQAVARGKALGVLPGS